jgi:hypothetical protein
MLEENILFIWYMGGSIQITSPSKHMDSVATMFINLAQGQHFHSVYSPLPKSHNPHLFSIQETIYPLLRLDCSWNTFHTNGLASFQNFAAGNHIMPSDVNTGIERMLMKLLNQLKLMFNSIYHTRGLRMYLRAKCLPSMHKALGSIYSSSKTKNKQTKTSICNSQGLLS